MADPSATRKADGNASFGFYVNIEVNNLARPSLNLITSNNLEIDNRPKPGVKGSFDAKKSKAELLFSYISRSCLGSSLRLCRVE
jgi:hypothetical protein